MGLTVYAENMGFFHKGSGGKGIAPGDVCMTPPPPPAGPIPVPYVNIAQASDLTKGSKTVKIDGEPTALEDVSECSTSTGNEPGSQPPKGVVTATNKGKASFKIWSFTVKVEGKGVCRHGDMMMQNTASDPPNCVDAAALTAFEISLGDNLNTKCPPYDGDNDRPPITKEQDEAVHGKPCWECQRQIDAGETPTTTGANWLHGETEYQNRSGGKYASRDREAMTPDHQPPLNVAWAKGGCNIPVKPDGFKKLFSKPEMVKSHCRRHSNSQGSQVAAYARRILAARK
ncbi:MAG: DUF4150 domain-containing protein [Pseudomonadota bacterium]